MKKKFITLVSVFAISLVSILPLNGQTENKVALLTVSGTGKTQEEAKMNALRNAIEQAFGAFISSNTQILNDQLVKDEIVSVSSGNIQEYIILSEVQTPDGSWANTIKAKVAIDKLTSFCESKGVKVEFKGALFTLNVKQQILNEENEIKVVKNTCNVLKEIISRCFDYEIAAAEPTSLGSNNNWKIPISIKIKTNANFKIISDYLGYTLKGLSLTTDEVLNYVKLSKEYTTIAYCPLGYQPKQANKKSKKAEITSNSQSLIYLRKEESLNALIDLIVYFRKSLLNFAVINDIKTIQGEDLVENYRLQLSGDKSFLPILLDRSGYTDIFRESVYSSDPLLYKPHISSYDRNQLGGNTSVKINTLQFGDPKYYEPSRFFPFLAEFDANSLFGKFGQIDMVITFWLFNTGYLAAVLTYDDKLTLDKLNKISGYKIIPRIGGSEVDQEGKVFKTTYVGNLRWMAQDLNVKHFSNGDEIPGIFDREPDKWQATKEPAYTRMTSEERYKLYNWYTINDKRNVCPTGWHVPSESEWGIMIDFLGGKEVAGGKLKGIKNERGYDYWKTPNIGATNEFFFTSIATDVRDGWGNVPINWLENCFYWMKSALDSSNAGKSVIISFNSAELKIGLANAHAGLAIRCIKD